MTPEEDIAQAVSKVFESCGHWPYTCDAELFAGWRPARDRYAGSASDGSARVVVTYDIVIAWRRGKELSAQKRRFALYNQLRLADFTVTATGPEEYVPDTEMFYWPVTAERAYALTIAGQPIDPKERRGTP